MNIRFLLELGLADKIKTPCVFIKKGISQIWDMPS